MVVAVAVVVAKGASARNWVNIIPLMLLIAYVIKQVRLKKSRKKTKNDPNNGPNGKILVAPHKLMFHASALHTINFVAIVCAGKRPHCI